MIKKFLYIVTYIYLIGCNNNHNKKDQDGIIFPTLKSDSIRYIDIDHLVDTTIIYSDIFKNISYIPLETTPESIIGRISHVELLNDTLYVFDSSSSKSLYLFSSEGKFIRRIGTLGRGPGEYVQPSSFTVNPKKREIYILDRYLQRISVFSIDGNFKNQIQYSSDVRSNYIKFCDDNLYLDARMPEHSKVRYLIRCINSKGEVSKRWLEGVSYNKGWSIPYFIGGSGSFYSAPNDIKYVDIFMDTIYSISSKGVVPFISIKTSNYLTPEHLSFLMQSHKNEIHNSIMLSLSKEDVIWSIHNYVENNSIISFRYKIRNIIKSVIIYKDNWTAFNWKSSIDDITNKSNPQVVGFPYLHSGSNDKLVGSIQFTNGLIDPDKKNGANMNDTFETRIIDYEVIGNPTIVIYQSK